LEYFGIWHSNGSLRVDGFASQTFLLLNISFVRSFIERYLYNIWKWSIL